MKEADTIGWNAVNIKDCAPTVPTLTFNLSSYAEVIIEYDNDKYMLDVDKFLKLCCYKKVE